MANIALHGRPSLARQACMSRLEPSPMNQGRNIDDVMIRRLKLAPVVVRLCALLVIVSATFGCTVAPTELMHSIILPEARTIDYRDPGNLPSVPIPVSAPPRTVSNPRPDLTDWPLSLDDAVRIALDNTRVVRVLTGISATTSGKTIYDAAITQTAIDQAQARFDPVFNEKAEWQRRNAPGAIGDPFDFRRSRIFGNASDSFLSTFGVTQNNVLGGQAGITWIENPLRFPGGST